jgi:ArsR family transcriptional regulator
MLGKVIGDEHRIRALMALRAGELCACQLIDLLGLAPSTVSRHMSLLSRGGLVKARKRGRWTYYRLPGDQAPPAVRDLLSWLERACQRDRRLAADQRRLKRIRSVAPEVLCRRRQRE